jgi:putative transposase
MKLTVAVKLQPSQEQAHALLQTIERANAAANYISEWAWYNCTFRQYDLHKALYYEVKRRYSLSAQVVVRVLAKVADAYKLDRKRQREFRNHGSIAYDDRILAWIIPQQEISIWTLDGREHIPFVCGKRNLAMLQSRQGETDLLLRDGDWYLYTTVDVEEPPPGEPTGWLGVDLGIVNLATTSEGTVYSGKHTTSIRHRNTRLRTRLQSKGTKAAKRLLLKRRKKEQRFSKHINHCISKGIVREAKALGQGIALENLSGISGRVTVRASQKRTLHSWAFHQLRQHISYKAALAGVPIVLVDPRNTSRMCAECGYTDKANRPSQSLFLCKSCQYSALADYNAAVNISRAACKPAVLLETSVTRKGVQSQVSGQSPAL